MIKITAKQHRRRHEAIDRTEDREEAEFLRREYAMAFGPLFTIDTMVTKGQSVKEKIAELRGKGLTAGKIMERTGLSRHTVDVYCQQLIRDGMIERRKGGGKEKLTERNQQIIDARKSGLSVPQVAERFGMGYFAVRSLLYKFRKQGRL